ncbi:MAG: tyrosine-type recombinase/integrase [Ignavibacteria bacterium]|nr:tyrosine-type recombinase/integrase [Ignavibacteria bacterium]
MAIKPTSNGKYVVDVRDEYGVRLVRRFNTKTEARAFEAMHTQKKYENRLIKSDMKNLRYLIERELDHFEQTKMDLRPGSIKRYKYIISQIKLFVKAHELTYVDEFTPDHATLFKEVLMSEKKDPKGTTDRVLKAKPKTINFFLATMKAFFQQEYIKGHIERNPMLHIKNIRVEKRKADYYTIAELKDFFAQDMHSGYRHAFMGFLLTGMRFSELAQLTWNDVDLNRLTIHVHSHEGFVTKTHNAERIIPIGVDLYKLLKIMAEVNGTKGLVFPSPKGGKLLERGLLGKCKKLAKAAGIKSQATIHKFRHTYATMLIHRGVSIQNIKELLGHSSVVQTEIYAHNKADHLHNDVSKLDNLLQS